MTLHNYILPVQMLTAPDWKAHRYGVGITVRQYADSTSVCQIGTMSANGVSLKCVKHCNPLSEDADTCWLGPQPSACTS